MNLRIASIFLIMLMAVGCQTANQGADQGAGQASSEVATTPPAPVEPQPTQVVDPGPSQPVVSAPVSRGPTDAELRQITTLYFDFDRSDIRSENQSVISAHARYLAENPNLRVRLEGHADERGSREYNIGLGERRAQAVRSAMQLQGVQNSQAKTLSYGEEKPSDPGHNEYAWQQNRRVEIVYF